MPFINKRQAFKLLDDMIKGKQNCIGDCRQVWLRNIGYTLKTATNPLKLTPSEHALLADKLAEVKGKGKGKKTQNVTKKQTAAKKTQNGTKKQTKKYATRKSPPYPANEHCGETMKGNDGKSYTSVPNKNNVCRWVLAAV
jgi:hypothetical protein